MEYNSFYGGRRGASFIISKSFKTIYAPAEDNVGFNKIIRLDLGLAENATITTAQRKAWLSDNCMVYCFSQGGAYKTVNYDEYVIIDTYNKNDIDNGKIYRRGYDYNNELGGANYIGQIVGPAGMAPHTELKDYSKVIKMTTEDGLVIPNDGTTITDKSLNQYRKTQSTLSINGEKDLIPGQLFNEDGEEIFNDNIEYVACSIRDFDSHESTVHIGFKIPYLVNVYTANSVSPYYHRSDLEPKDLTGDLKWAAWDAASEQLNGKGTENFNNKELIQRTDDLSHPFFSKWDISIPKGIKGDAFKNLRITTVAEEAIKDIVLQDYNGKQDDIYTAEDKKRQILVYDYYDYDRDPSGDPVALYLGDYNMIDNVSLNEDGTLSIDYSHDDKDVYTKMIKWIKNVSLNPETGNFVMTFNYDKEPSYKDSQESATKIDLNLTWLKDLTISPDGTVKWFYTTSEDNRQDNNLIKWITDTSLNSETGEFIMNFNYGDEETQVKESLTWVKDINVAADGSITFIYTDKDNKVYDKYIKWIDDLNLAENGTLTIDYNDNTSKTFDNKIKWITNTQLADNGIITVNYNDGTSNILDKTIKWITKSSIAADGTIVITYNNGTSDTFNKTLKWIDKISLTETGVFTIDYNNGAESFVANIITPSSITVDTGATEGEGSQKLQITYNNGTVKEVGNPINYIMESVVAIPPSQGEINAGFLYDANYAYHLLVLYSDPARRAAGPNVRYNNRRDWVDLGYIGQGNTGAIVSKENDPSGIALAQSLPPYSAWFIIEE